MSTATVTFIEDHNGDQFKLINSPTFKCRIYVGNAHIGDIYDEARADEDFARFKHEHDLSELVSLSNLLLKQYSKKELDPNIPAHALCLRYLEDLLEKVNGCIYELEDIDDEYV